MEIPNFHGAAERDEQHFLLEASNLHERLLKLLLSPRFSQLRHLSRSANLFLHCRPKVRNAPDGQTTLVRIHEAAH